MSNPGAQFFLFFDTILVLKQLVVITRTKAIHSVKKKHACTYKHTDEHASSFISRDEE